MKILDIKPTVGIRIEKKHYDFFFNQQLKGGKSERVLFKMDYQRFLWAFILGIKSGERLPLSSPTESAFKWEIIQRRNNMSQLMVGLVIQEKYKDNPEQLREDFENAESSETSFSDELRVAVEEYANKGFEILTQKSILDPGYIENVQSVVNDILDSTKI